VTLARLDALLTAPAKPATPLERARAEAAGGGSEVRGAQVKMDAACCGWESGAAKVRLPCAGAGKGAKGKGGKGAQPKRKDARGAGADRARPPVRGLGACARQVWCPAGQERAPPGAAMQVGRRVAASPARVALPASREVRLPASRMHRLMDAGVGGGRGSWRREQAW
jgi:hypothetical protein